MRALTPGLSPFTHTRPVIWHKTLCPPRRHFSHSGGTLRYSGLRVGCRTEDSHSPVPCIVDASHAGMEMEMRTERVRRRTAPRDGGGRLDTENAQALRRVGNASNLYIYPLLQDNLDVFLDLRDSCSDRRKSKKTYLRPVGISSAPSAHCARCCPNCVGTCLLVSRS